jgi:uncharacterized protein YecT (DUF1311 family)
MSPRSHLASLAAFIVAWSQCAISSSDADCGGELDCLSAAYESADLELNAIYKQTMAALSATRRNELRQEERSWIKFTEDQCTQRAGDMNGREATELILSCKTDETVSRTQRLKIYWSK